MHAYKCVANFGHINNDIYIYIQICMHSYKTSGHERAGDYSLLLPRNAEGVRIRVHFLQHNIPPPSLPSLASANSFSLLSCMYIILLLEKCHNCIFKGGIWNLKLTSWLVGPEKTELAGLLLRLYLKWLFAWAWITETH